MMAVGGLCAGWWAAHQQQQRTGGAHAHGEREGTYTDPASKMSEWDV
jgi:hypothetical protein